MDDWGWVAWLIGGVTLAVAFWTLLSTRKGTRDASVARSLAEETKRRDTELHDVHWHYYWYEPGKLALVNVGQDAAQTVRFTMHIQGKPHQHHEIEEIEPNTALVIDIPEYFDFAGKKPKETPESKAFDQWLGPIGQATSEMPRMFSVAVSIQWRSPAGNPQHYHHLHQCATLEKGRI